MPLTSRPRMFSASIAGSSWNRPESSGLAPIRSPEPTVIVFALVVRSALTVADRYSAPPAGTVWLTIAPVVAFFDWPVWIVPGIDWPRSLTALTCPWKSLNASSWTDVSLSSFGGGAPSAGTARTSTASTASAAVTESRVRFISLLLPWLQSACDPDQLLRLRGRQRLPDLCLDLVDVRVERLRLRRGVAARGCVLGCDELVEERRRDGRVVRVLEREPLHVREGGLQLEPDEHGVVVGRPVGVRRPQRVLRVRLERRVVVEHVRLVGVDVPLGHLRDLRRDARIPQRVVEVARHPVEHVRVRVWAEVAGDEVRPVVPGAGGVVGAALDRADRVLLRVRVEVAHDQEVRVAAAGRVGLQPVDERLCRLAACAVAVALAVARVRVADVVAVGALRLQVVDDDREAGPVLERLERLSERGAALRVDEPRVDRGGQELERPDGL